MSNYCPLGLDIITPRNLTPALIIAIEGIIKEGFEFPFCDYTIWYKRFRVDCLVYPYIECDSCPRLEKLECIKCKEKEPIIHHTYYGVEAIPTLGNRDWMKYYKLLCDSCHRKEHYQHSELNNRKQWNETISKTIGWGAKYSFNRILLTRNEVEQWISRISYTIIQDCQNSPKKHTITPCPCWKGASPIASRQTTM